MAFLGGTGLSIPGLSTHLYPHQETFRFGGGYAGASKKRRLRNAGPAHVARAGEGREERGEALEAEVGSAGLAQAGPGDRAPVSVRARASAPR